MTEEPAAPVDEPAMTEEPVEPAAPMTERRGGWLDEIDVSVVAGNLQFLNFKQAPLTCIPMAWPRISIPQSKKQACLMHSLSVELLYHVQSRRFHRHHRLEPIFQP